MSGHSIVSVIAGAVCFSVGVIVGIGLAIAKPGIVRNLSLKIGRPDPYKQWYYEQTVKFHKRIDANVPDGTVIFIGDSFIQGLCVTEIVPGGINYGIGGDTTEGVMARLPVYASLTNARAVVFTVGDNDLRVGRSEAEVTRNYREILARMPKSLPIFFCTIAPCVEKSEFAEINRGIAFLNRSLKELCAADSRCHLVDLQPTLNDERGCLRREFADDDGVHLNGKGYRLCIEKLRESLGSIPPNSAKAAAKGI